MYFLSIRFLSTLSLRRATLQRVYLFQAFAISIHALLAESDQTGTIWAKMDLYFYPRSPCGERHRFGWLIFRCYMISIHALLAESDGRIFRRQSLRCAISIHALLAESDWTGRSCNSRSGNFYPRSPCGERPFVSCTLRGSLTFLSTLSLRRATSLYIT